MLEEPQVPDTDLMILANRAGVLGSVLPWVLHDMRNPVQVLCLLTEPAGESAGATGSGRLTEALSQFSERLGTDLALLERLLRPLPERGTAIPTSVGDSVRFIDQLARRSRARDRVDVSTALAARLPAAGTTQEHVDQALLNLLLNAIESQDPTAHITIGAEAARDVVRIWVQDDGPGIDPSVRSSLFTAPATTKRGRPGRGLGLLVTRLLARACGGDLQRGEVATGSRFDLLLPAWRSPAPAGSS